MRYGIFSDVHSNLEALKAVLAGLQREKIDRLVFLGDIVGYGADPEACVAQMKTLMDAGALCVKGNHDAAIQEQYDMKDFVHYAREAIIWSRRQLSPEHADVLNRLALVQETEHFTAVHASLDEPDKWHYLFDIDDACISFERLDQKICFVGHTHKPVVFSSGETVNWFYPAADKPSLPEKGTPGPQSGSRAEESPSVNGFESVCTPEGGGDLHRKILRLRRNCRYIVNVGSVGQPRDGDPRASYVVYDAQQEQVEYHRISYDVALAGRKILEAGLPHILAERLLIGK